MNFDLKILDFPTIELPANLIDNTEIALLIDDFEDEKTIKFIECGYGIFELGKKINTYFRIYKENESPYHYFGISLVNHNGFIYLDIECRGGLNLATNDYFIILYEDGSKQK